ncbi:MAG TPA: PilN domain-containing protein [bacterium]|nr:PilN domain-containing protein [bacterium]
MQELNFLPQSEIQEQYKEKAVKFSSILAIIFTVFVALGSVYIVYLNKQNEQKISDLDKNIESLRSQIKSKAEIEIKVRNLDKKYKALTNIFMNQKKYSLLMQEIRTRKPSSLDIDNLDMRGESLNINGSAQNYLSIAEFINNLLNTEFTGGISGLETVFTKVSLNSVNTDSSKDTIGFFIVVNFDSSKLK